MTRESIKNDRTTGTEDKNKRQRDDDSDYDACSESSDVEEKKRSVSVRRTKTRPWTYPENIFPGREMQHESPMRPQTPAFLREKPRKKQKTTASSYDW